MINSSEYFILTNDDISMIREELAALEKNPVHGWDRVYPTLYNVLYKAIDQIRQALGCSMSGLVIQCQGAQSMQASSYIMLDGTTQLHLGSRFIREYLLDSGENRDRSQRIFTWVIAHELAHLADPTFKAYGSRMSYAVRTAIDRFITILFGIGLGYVLLTSQSKQGLALIGFSSALLIFKMFVTMFLHRAFEYKADELSVKAIRDLNKEEIRQALENMTLAIRQALVEQFTFTNSFLKNIFIYISQKVMLCKVFLLHPSVAKRVARLAKF